jgi:hypothetical protein
MTRHFLKAVFEVEFAANRLQEALRVFVELNDGRIPSEHIEPMLDAAYHDLRGNTSDNGTLWETTRYVRFVDNPIPGTGHGGLRGKRRPTLQDNNGTRQGDACCDTA